MNFSELYDGMKLPVLERQITQEKINRYAEASKDFNPIHINREFAEKTPLGGTVAHGMLSLAYISQLMTKSFGERWRKGGKMNIRFRNPARPGDTLKIEGKIVEIRETDEGKIVVCDITCSNQKGEQISTGETEVRYR